MLKMSGSQAASVVGKTEKDKRLISLTEKALANKIETIQTDRKRHVNKMKSVIMSLKELMKDDKNHSQVKNSLMS